MWEARTIPTLEEYKVQNKGKNLPQEKLYKQLTQVDKTIRETADGLQIDFIISTSMVDRDQDVINSDGWQLDNFNKNPVVLWAHDRREPPVGKSIKVWLEDGILKSTAQFPTKDLYEFGYTIGQMYKNGYLNAVSVGFKSIEAHWATDEDIRPYGIDYNKQELLEYSCVPIPANPEALLDSKAGGLDVVNYFDLAVKCLDLKDNKLIPTEIAEKIYNILKVKSTFLMPRIAELTQNHRRNLKMLDYFEKRIQINENLGRSTP